jgi:hypothetical protein
MLDAYMCFIQGAKYFSLILLIKVVQVSLYNVKFDGRQPHCTYLGALGI